MPRTFIGHCVQSYSILCESFVVQSYEQSVLSLEWEEKLQLTCDRWLLCLNINWQLELQTCNSKLNLIREIAGMLCLIQLLASRIWHMTCLLGLSAYFLIARMWYSILQKKNFEDIGNAQFQKQALLEHISTTLGLECTLLMWCRLVECRLIREQAEL